MKIKTKYLLSGIFLAICGLLVIGYIIGHERGVNASQPLISSLNSQISTYSMMLDGEKKFVTQKEQEILTLKQAIKNGDISKEELRKLHLKDLSEISRLELQVDTLLTNISHNGQIITILNSRITNQNGNQDTISRYNAIRLPFSFDQKDKWLNLSGIFNSIGKMNIDIKLNFNADLLIGIDKTTKKNTAILTTDCPYIKTVSFNSVKMDTPKEKHYGIGIFMGYGFNLGSTVKTSPVIGAGLLYDIFKF
jgi:hypothetical protein